MRASLIKLKTPESLVESPTFQNVKRYEHVLLRTCQARITVNNKVIHLPHCKSQGRRPAKETLDLGSGKKYLKFKHTNIGVRYSCAHFLWSVTSEEWGSNIEYRKFNKRYNFTSNQDLSPLE